MSEFAPSDYQNGAERTANDYDADSGLDLDDGVSDFTYVATLHKALILENRPPIILPRLFRGQQMSFRRRMAGPIPRWVNLSFGLAWRMQALTKSSIAPYILPIDDVRNLTHIA